MSYQITLSNGSVLVNVADNTLDNSTSLTLVGQNFLGYGTAIADNFVRLLENAANTVAPAHPLVGQLWYNSATTIMSVWTGTHWLSLAIGVSSVLGQTGAITLLELTSGGLAPSVSPILTGVPQAPTAPTGTDTNQIASTAFVLNEVASLSTGVISVIGNTGIVTLAQLVSGGLAPQVSPTLTGVPKAPTAPLGTSTTQIASTAFVVNQIGALSTGVISVLGNTGIVTLIEMTNGGLAPIASPAFSGVPQAATAAPLTATTQIATTAFVTNAINALPSFPANPKTRITAPLNLYVAPNGNDSNAGTALTTAFLTLQRAWNVILYNYDLNGFAITVNIADGTYNAGVVCSGTPVGASLLANLAVGNFGSSYGGPSPVVFKGSSGNASNCIITTTNTACFSASFGAQIDVTNMTLRASGAAAQGATNGSALLSTTGGYIGALAVIFGNCGNSHMEAYGGLIGTGGSYTVSGSAACHYLATRMGHINANLSTITFTGSPSFSSAFAQAEYASVVEIGISTFNNAGAVGGARYFARFGGIVDTEGGSQSYLPGSNSGSVDASTYGIYL